MIFLVYGYARKRMHRYHDPFWPQENVAPLPRLALPCLMHRWPRLA
jgi:hypothetical protein